MEEHPLTIVKSEPLPVLSIVKSEPDQSFIPSTAKEWGQRLAAAAIDVPVGMAKNAGRMVQAIPGVTAATDAIYSLPKGASSQAMQPSNPTQEAGGYVADAAALAAGAGEIGTAGKVWNRTEGWIDNPTVRERGIATIKDAVAFAADTVKAAQAELSGGELTPEKLGGLIAKYGKKTAGLAVKGALGLGAYEAYKKWF